MALVPALLKESDRQIVGTWLLRHHPIRPAKVYGDNRVEMGS